MAKQTVFESLEQLLASNRRRVVSDWRTVILLRQALEVIPENERRWTTPPANIPEARILLHRLAASGHLAEYPAYPHLYRVTSPYANQDPIEEDELLMELHPYAAISHHSALVFHHLTNQFPNEIHVSVPTDGSRVLPVGTKENDFFPGMSAFRGRTAGQIGGTPIAWHHLDRFFGYSEHLSKGYPVRVVTIEKTLIDGLAAPEWCGGLTNVLQAWVSARDALNLKTVMRFTDRQDVGVLRQRVGYVLEELGFSDPQLEDWTAKAKRGGSSKLLGSAPFAPTFSERWKISLNAPVSSLREDPS